MSTWSEAQPTTMAEVLNPIQFVDNRYEYYTQPNLDWGFSSVVRRSPWHENPFDHTSRLSLQHQSLQGIDRTGQAGQRQQQQQTLPTFLTQSPLQINQEVNSRSRPSKRKASEPPSTPLFAGSSMSQYSRQSSLASSGTTQPTLFSNLGSGSSATSPPTSARSFTPIAPDPVGLQRIQAIRQSQELEEQSEASRAKRRRTLSIMENNQGPPTLREEDRLLLSLKDDQSLPWKDIASKFEQETGKVHMIPALQMRYKRLKERLQVWTEADLDALKSAHDYWESRKFDIISAKMLEFGATDKFSPKSCQRKWQDLHPTPEYMHQLPIGSHQYGPPPHNSPPHPQPPYASPYPQHFHTSQPAPYQPVSGYSAGGHPPPNYMHHSNSQRLPTYPPTSGVPPQQPAPHHGGSYWS